MKPKETHMLIAQLCSLQMYAYGRLAALESTCLVLWEESGRKPEDLKKFISDEAAKTNEQFLLSVGDAHPELAKIADILKQLERDQDT